VENKKKTRSLHDNSPFDCLSFNWESWQ